MRLLFILSFLFISNQIFAQDANLNTYNFSEGIEFVNDNDHSFKIAGYVQPFMESRFVLNDTLNEKYLAVSYTHLTLPTNHPV